MEYWKVFLGAHIIQVEIEVVINHNISRASSFSNKYGN